MAYIEPGIPWENDYCESFNRCMRDEFVNGELFVNLREAEILPDLWGSLLQHCQTVFKP